MKRKISISNVKSANYVFNNFLKQFRKALDHYSVGQMLNSKQLLAVLSFMGFVEDQPTLQDAELAKTITKMLADCRSNLSVKRMNLFQFLITLCDIPEVKESANSSCFEEEIPGLVMDQDQIQEPLIVMQFGRFDQYGKWTCTHQQKQQIKAIFASMRLKRISRNEVQSRKRTPKKQQMRQTFKPRICPKSNKIAQMKIKRISFEGNQRVENRLLQSKQKFHYKIQAQLNQSMQKQLQQCTFKPMTNNYERSQSKQNRSFRSSSQGHFKSLIDKGNAYRERKERLRQLQIKINQSTELQSCTFKPETTKHSNSAKWVYVRNRDKEIERLREGRKQRQFLNKVKERGYPAGVNWSQFISKKSTTGQKWPILCIDLKIMNQQYNINVYDGQNLIAISERISRQHKIPEKMWWKVEELIRNAVQQCDEIRVENNRVFAQH